jgi:hypothetical protein
MISRKRQNLRTNLIWMHSARRVLISRLECIYLRLLTQLDTCSVDSVPKCTPGQTLLNLCYSQPLWVLKTNILVFMQVLIWQRTPANVFIYSVLHFILHGNLARFHAWQGNIWIRNLRTHWSN